MTSLPNRMDPYSTLKDLGYVTFLDYSKHRPSSTFQDLAKELGGDSGAAADVFRLMRDEVATNHDFHHLLASSLFRKIKSLVKNGWKKDGRIVFAFTNACSGWAALFEPRYKESCLVAIKQLRSVENPEEWIPDGIDDSDIVAAIAAGKFDFP